MKLITLLTLAVTLFSAPAFAQDITLERELANSIADMERLLQSPDFALDAVCTSLASGSYSASTASALAPVCAEEPKPKNVTAAQIMATLSGIKAIVINVDKKAETNKRDINTLRSNFLSFQTPYPATTTPRPSQRTPRQLPKKDPFWR